MKTTQTLLAVAVLFTAGAANATLVSALGGQVVNDTDLNVTWLSNANLAATETFGLARNVDLGGIPGVITYGGSYIYNDGRMTWGGAMKWIAAMNASNGGAGYLGYNNWRLPTTAPVNGSTFDYSFSNIGSADKGYNVSAQGTVYAGSTGSEMAHLYYNSLDNKGRCNPTTSTASLCVSQSGYGLVNDLANPNDESMFSNFQSDVYWSGSSNTEVTQGPTLAWDFYFQYGLQSNLSKGGSLYALAVRSGQVVATPVPGAALLLGSGLLGLIGVARRRLVIR